MISLQSGYRSFNRLLPFWFPFFSFLKLEFPITISNHSVLLFSAVALAKWIKEVSAIPGFSLNTLSESSSSLLERNADCLPTEHRAPGCHSMTEHRPWALKSGDLRFCHSTAEQTLRGTKSPPDLLLALFICLRDFHYFMWNPWFLRASIHSCDAVPSPS